MRNKIRTFLTRIRKTLTDNTGNIIYVTAIFVTIVAVLVYTNVGRLNTTVSSWNNRQRISHNIEITSIESSLNTQLHREKYPDLVDIDDIYLERGGEIYTGTVSLDKGEETYKDSSLSVKFSNNGTKINQIILNTGHIISDFENYHVYLYNQDNIEKQVTFSKDFLFSTLPLLDGSQKGTEVEPYIQVIDNSNGGSENYTIIPNNDNRVLYDDEGNKLYEEMIVYRTEQEFKRSNLVKGFTESNEISNIGITPTKNKVEIVVPVFYDSAGNIIGYSIVHLGGEYHYIQGDTSIVQAIPVSEDVTDIYIVRNHQTLTGSGRTIKDTLNNLENTIHLEYYEEMFDEFFQYGYKMSSTLQNKLRDTEFLHTIDSMSKDPTGNESVTVTLTDMEHGNILDKSKHTLTGLSSSLDFTTFSRVDITKPELPVIGTRLDLDFLNNTPTQLTIVYEELESVEYSGYMKLISNERGVAVEKPINLNLKTIQYINNEEDYEQW